MQDTFEDSIRREFINEAIEMLEEVESAFIRFERNPLDRAEIDKIFRLAHTIKGSAMTCGFAGLGAFAHILETLLVRLREEKLAADAHIVDILLQANDRLRTYLSVLEMDFNAQIDTSAIVDAIQNILGPDARESVNTFDFAEGFGLFEDESPGFGVFEDTLPQIASDAMGDAIQELLRVHFEVLVSLTKATQELDAGEEKGRLLHATTELQKGLDLLVALKNVS